MEEPDGQLSLFDLGDSCVIRTWNGAGDVLREITLIDWVLWNELDETDED